MHFKFKNKGFTLIELAMVLVIIGLLLGGILSSLSAQLELRQINASKKDLNDIKLALIGYAMSHAAADGKPYLPCPDTDANGTENRNAGLCTNVEGDLPWADLGMPNLDSWDNLYQYRVTQTFADSNIGIRLITPATQGNMNIRAAAAGNIIASNVPVVVFSTGKNGASGGADEAENNNNNTDFVSHESRNVAGNEFDDIVDWIPSYTLFKELVAAGKLP